MTDFHELELRTLFGEAHAFAFESISIIQTWLNSVHPHHFAMLWMTKSILINSGADCKDVAFDKLQFNFEFDGI